MRRAPAAAAIVAGLAVLVVVGVVAFRGSSPGGGAPPRPLAVATSLSPQPTFFGDPLTAEVDVLYDPAAVHGVRVAPSFVPYVQRGATRVERTRAGRLERLRYRYVLQCLTDACLPGDKPKTVQLPPVQVTAGSTSQQAAWPAATIVTRLQPADVAARRPPFRRPHTLPPPVYSVSPGALANGVAVAAVLLVAAALVLLALEARRLLARRRQRLLGRLTPLEAALLRAREAAARPDPADRRKALGLLAETLGPGRLAESADEVAWSERPPTPARTLQLADEVEVAAGNGDAP